MLLQSQFLGHCGAQNGRVAIVNYFNLDIYSVCETLTLLLTFISSLFLRIRLRYSLTLIICFVRLMLDFMIIATVRMADL